MPLCGRALETLEAARSLWERGESHSRPRRRAKARPVDVLRGHALRRFASWTEAHPHPDLSSAADAYAEHLLEDGAAIATVAADLGAVRWWATAAAIEGADKLGRAPLADARRDGERARFSGLLRPARFVGVARCLSRLF